MQFALTVLALAASAFANPAPQAVTSAIAPSGSAPAGCESSYNGQFEVTVVKPLAKRDLSKRQSTCGKEGILTLQLQGGVLTDNQGRTGYIADNYQFQFDKPPQAGATVTSGFSICSNSSAARGDSSVKFLTLGDTTTFYQCLSGNFYNLYNKNWAPQCAPVAIQILPCPGASGASSQAPSTGSATAPGATTLTVGPTTTPAPATVISDGQPQASSAAPYVPPVITVISDGQPQAQSAIPLSQKADGQPNMPTALVSQLADGQPQASSAAPIAATSSAAPVSQIGDGQPQAGNATVLPTASPTIAPYKGAAAGRAVLAEFAVLAAGGVAVALL